MSITAIPSDPFTRRLQKIGQMIANKDLHTAATELNAAVKKFPNDPRVFLLAARMAEVAGNLNRAEESIRKAVSLNPAWVVGVMELALLLSRMSRPVEAIEQVKKAMNLAPDSEEVLARGVDIAHHGNDRETALECLRKLSALRPENSFLKAMIARDLRALGDDAAAMVVYTEMLERNPHDRDGLLGRAQVQWSLNDLNNALIDTQALISLEPENQTFQFWHVLATGGVPSRMPIATVQMIFDNEAAGYDVRRVRGMNYELPKKMADLIKLRQPDAVMNVLDLGCGTGLLGLYLGEFEGVLVGVDASMGMVAQLTRHQGLYDKVHTVNVLDALEATPADLYHVIAACDVFSYVGDLAQAIPNAFRIVRPGGHLVFSCELAQESEADFVLRPSLRFAHQRGAVEALCRAAGFDTVEVVETSLFNDGGNAVNGYIVLAHKPA